MTMYVQAIVANVIYSYKNNIHTYIPIIMYSTYIMRPDEMEFTQNGGEFLSSSSADSSRHAYNLFHRRCAYIIIIIVVVINI